MQLLHYAKAYLTAYIVAPIVRLFDRGLDGFIAEITKFDAKIDAFLDREADRRVTLLEERTRLRDRIDALWADYDASVAASERAGRIQERMKELIK